MFIISFHWQDNFLDIQFADYSNTTREILAY